MNFSQLLVVLLGRWRTVLLAMLVLAGSALAVGLILPKKYAATVAVLVDSRSADALGSATERMPSPNQVIMTTQADLIGSERVARRVVAQLDLENDETLRGHWLDETGGVGDASTFIAKQLLLKLNVRPNRDSNVISISFVGSEAKHAAAIANAFAQASIDANLDLKVEPARQFAGWFNERTKTLRNNLETAQERLTVYQRQHGLVGTAGGQIDIENAKLAQLASQLVQIQAARAESDSRQTQARGNARTSPDVLNNGVVAGLRAAITTGEGNLRQLGTQYGEGHPQVIVAREHLATLKTQLESEMQSVVRTLTTADTVNRQRESETRNALETQRVRVLALMTGSDDVAVLQRDVESAKLALSAATTRQSQTSLESQVQQTNVYLLAPAAEPTAPSGPKVPLYVVSAAAFGLLIGIALALWQESRAPLIRNFDDLSLVLSLPVLATLPRAELPQRPIGMRQLANRIAPS